MAFTKKGIFVPPTEGGLSVKKDQFLSFFQNTPLPLPTSAGGLDKITPTLGSKVGNYFDSVFAAFPNSSTSNTSTTSATRLSTYDISTIFSDAPLVPNNQDTGSSPSPAPEKAVLDAAKTLVTSEPAKTTDAPADSVKRPRDEEQSSLPSTKAPQEDQHVVPEMESKRVKVSHQAESQPDSGMSDDDDGSSMDGGVSMSDIKSSSSLLLPDRKKEKNRLAAKKCRDKKKKNNMYMQSQYERLSERQKKLMESLHLLAARYQEMREGLMLKSAGNRRLQDALKRMPVELKDHLEVEE